MCFMIHVSLIEMNVKHIYTGNERKGNIDCDFRWCWYCVSTFTFFSSSCFTSSSSSYISCFIFLLICCLFVSKFILTKSLHLTGFASLVFLEWEKHTKRYTLIESFWKLNHYSSEIWRLLKAHYLRTVEAHSNLATMETKSKNDNK